MIWTLKEKSIKLVKILDIKSFLITYKLLILIIIHFSFAYLHNLEDNIYKPDFVKFFNLHAYNFFI